MTSAPLSPEEFAATMTTLGWSGDALAVAVSGGSDSMALVMLLREWTAVRGIRLVAFTVDHALRAESAAEAVQVQQWLKARGLEHHILRWEHPPITQALQQTARQARYALLAAACQVRGIGALALAHQQEDQAETVLLRLAKGSGVDGLAAMRPLKQYQDMVLLRPLLAIPKARLIATCEAAGQDYVRDPSNHNPAYARGRLRAVTTALAEEGLTTERLSDLASRAALASDALGFYTRQLATQAVTQHPTGVLQLSLPLWRAAPQEIQLRLLRQMLDHAGGRPPIPVRHAALVSLQQNLQQPTMQPRTLRGCLITVRHDQATILREAAAIHDHAPIAPGESRVWDGRFHIMLAAHAPSGLILGKLGTVPHRLLDEIAPNLRHTIHQGRIRAALPALWQDGRLLAVTYHKNPSPLFTAEALLYPAGFVLS